MTRLSRRVQLKESSTRHWPDNYHNVYTLEENFVDNEGNDDLTAPLGTGNFSWSAGTGQVDDELKLDAIATVASKVNHTFWLADEEGDLPGSIVVSLKKRGSGMSKITLTGTADFKNWAGDFIDTSTGDYEWGGRGCYKSVNGTLYLDGASPSNDYQWYWSDRNDGSNSYVYIMRNGGNGSGSGSGSGSQWYVFLSIVPPQTVRDYFKSLTPTWPSGLYYGAMTGSLAIANQLGSPNETRGRYSPAAFDASIGKLEYEHSDLNRELVAFYESGNGDCLAKLAIDPTGRIYFNRYGKDSQSNYRYLSSDRTPFEYYSTGTAYIKNYHEDFDDGDWINIMVSISGIIDEVVEDKMYIDGVEIATGSKYAESSGGAIINEKGSSYKGMEDFSNGVVFKIGSGCREMSLDEIVLINEELDSSDATDIDTDFTNGTGSGG